MDEYPIYKYACIILIIIIILIAAFNKTIRGELLNMVTFSKKSPLQAISCFRGGPDSGDIRGTVVFTENENGTMIDINLSGVPYGKHGIHIHETGDLSEGCKSACDHFNPMNVNHGDLNNGHVGDMGNIESINGNVRTIIHSKQIKLKGSHSVIGRSVIIHAGEDDLGLGQGESLKTGNSGARIACAVIGYKKI